MCNRGPNALPIPPSAIVEGVADLSRDQIQEMIAGLRSQKEELFTAFELVEQRLRFLRYTCGPNVDWIDVENFTTQGGFTTGVIAGAQSSVGQLQWIDLNNPALGLSSPGNVSGKAFGSGALIGPNLFLTAGHCFDQVTGGWSRPRRNGEIISRAEIATLMKVVFNRQIIGGSANTPRPDVAEFRVVRLVEDCSEEQTKGCVDYAIVELESIDGRAPGATYGWLTPAATDVAEPNTPLSIIHFPGQPFKKVSVGTLDQMDCGVMSYKDIDTGPGSSGAPVLNTSGEIVGVHFFGECQGDGPPDSGANYAHAIGDIRRASVVLSA